MKRLASIIAIALAAAAAVAETPAYYVEWVQTAGTQFINTGVNGKAGIQTEIDFQFAALGNSVIVLGSSAGTDAAALGLDAANPVIPDAIGRARFHKPSPAPLDFANEATRFYVK